MTRKEKKNKDRFSVTLIGVLLYSLLLIGVMAGSYVGVKAIFANHEEAMAVEANTSKETIAEEEIVEEIPKEEEIEEELPAEEVEEEETTLNEHEIDIAKIINPETGYVDYSNINFKPARRQEDLKWKDNVFSKIENVSSPSEALVNDFVYKRVNATSVDQKSIDYKCYTNPDTNYIEKITEVVDGGKEYEIFDYYYDLGNINYVANYKMAIDKPIPLSSAQIESRFYFRDDVLVRYIYCSDSKATEYTVADIKSYSEGTIEQYDFLEKEIINRAYDVYNIAKTLNETELLYGYVLDEFLTPLEEAEVVVSNSSDGKTIAKTTTDADGYYKIAVKCNDQEQYIVTANKNSLNSVSVYGITAYHGTGKYAVEPIYMDYADNEAVYNVQLIARDAIDASKGIGNGSIKIRAGLNNYEGEVLLTGTLDDVGAALVPMEAGCYTAEVSKGGYETLYFPVVVRMDRQAAVGFAVPDVGENEAYVVLSWENAPLDLDLKIITSSQGSVLKSNADGLGTISAETVKIDDVLKDDYRVYVSDFGSISANNPMSYNLSLSNAYVSIYDADGIRASLHVPTASAGICWEALEIRNKKILPVNGYSYTIEDDPLWMQK